jgi:hypothetical protein
VDSRGPRAGIGGVDAVTTPEMLQVLSTIANFGALGIIFFLFVTGKLHSDAEFQGKLRDLEMERKAHDHTRESNRLMAARVETGALAAEIIAKVLSRGKVSDEA